MTFLLLMIVLILAVALFSCSKPVEEAADDVINVGWIGALTGDQASWGQSELNTIKLVFDNINKEQGGVLGKKLKIEGYDTKGDPNEAVNAVKTLINKDKVVAILGPNSSSTAIPISDILEKAKVASIATVATNQNVTMNNGKVKPYNFRVCFVDSYQGSVAAGYSIDNLKAQKAAILFNNSDEYSIGLAQYFEDFFVSKGGSIVAKESFKNGDTDFSSQLVNIIASKPDVLFMPFYYNEVGLCAKQAKSMGLKAVLMGADGWPSDDLYSQYKEYIEGAYIVNHMNPDDPEAQELKNKYMERYDSNIEINGYLVNDAILMLVDAIKRTGVINSEKIAKALEAADIKGITGEIKINKDTHNPEGKEAAIVKIVDGREVFMQKYSPYK